MYSQKYPESDRSIRSVGDGPLLQRFQRRAFGRRDQPRPQYAARCLGDPDRRKYSPNLWYSSASDAKTLGKSGDSTLFLHGFGECLLIDAVDEFVFQRDLPFAQRILFHVASPHSNTAQSASVIGH